MVAAKKILQSDTAPSTTDPDQLQEKLSELIDSLEIDLRAFDDACDRVADSLDPSALESSDEREEQENLDFQFEVQDILKRLKSVVKQLDRKVLQSSPDAQRAQADGVTAQLQQQMQQLMSMHIDTQKQAQAMLSLQKSSSTATQSTPGSVNLPKLSLPKFSGDLLNWSEFYDMFMSSVHDRTSLSDVQKFTYLKDCVTDVALETIAGLQLTSSNYSVALGLLKERFGDKQAQINAYHVALQDLPGSSRKTSDLRKFYDSLETNLRCLASLGEDTSQLFYITLITGKLPRHTLAQLELTKGATPWSVKSLRKALQNYVVAQESAKRLSGQPVSDKPKESRPSNNTAKSSALLVGSSSSALNVTCAFCKEPHFSDECPKFTTIDSRKKEASSRCFRCLRQGHTTSTCQATKPCYHCRRTDHHRSLCPTKFKSQSSLNSSARSFTPKQATNAFAGEDKDVIMQTALAQIVVPSSTGPVETQARLLFDTGSSRSFVSQSLQSRANLPVVGHDHISLATLAGCLGTRQSTLEYPSA